MAVGCHSVKGLGGVGNAVAVDEYAVFECAPGVCNTSDRGPHNDTTVGVPGLRIRLQAESCHV